MADRRTVTCPHCGATSAHPRDVAEGYCGECHDWTSPPAEDLPHGPGVSDEDILLAMRDLKEDR